MSFNEYDRTTRPQLAVEDMLQAVFSKTIAEEIAVRVKSILGNSQGQEVAITACDQLEVNEGVRSTVISKELSVTKGTPVIAREGAANLVGRTSVLLQATDGDFILGFEQTKLIFKITKGNFFEVKLPAALDLWVEPISGTKKIAVAELK